MSADPLLADNSDSLDLDFLDNLNLDPNDSSTSNTSDLVAPPAIIVDDDAGLSETIIITPPNPTGSDRMGDLFSDMTDDNITPMETDPDPATNARLSRQSKTFDELPYPLVIPLMKKFLFEDENARLRAMDAEAENVRAPGPVRNDSQQRLKAPNFGAPPQQRGSRSMPGVGPRGPFPAQRPSFPGMRRASAQSAYQRQMRRLSAASFGIQQGGYSPFTNAMNEADENFIPPDPAEGDLDVKNWGVGDVVEWLVGLEGGILQQYAPFFTQFNVTGPVLLKFNQSNLLEFNMRSVGHRQRFMHHLRLLRRSGIVETGRQRYLVPNDGIVLRIQHLRVRKYTEQSQPSWWNILTGLYRDRQLMTQIETISATFLPGRVTGIFGSRHRETLLQVLSGFNLDPDWVVTGDILVNNVPFHDSLVGAGIATYIDRKTLCEGMEEMTIGELINLAVSLSRVKLKSDTEDSAQDILRLVNLSHPRKTRIKFLSQYEKLKLQMCMDVIMGNSVLLINDPLTGLTSAEALSLLHFLQDFSRRKSLTIVLAIDRMKFKHFWDYIEQVVILGDFMDLFYSDEYDLEKPVSSISFAGTPADALAYFKRHEVKFNLHENPLDTILSETQNDVEYMHVFAAETSFKYRQKRGAVNIHDYDQGAVNNFCVEIFILIRFLIQSSFNDIVKFDLELIILLAWCFVLGLCYWDVGNDFDGTNERVKLIILIGMTPYLGLRSFVGFRNKQRLWTERHSIGQRVRVATVSIAYVFLAYTRSFIMTCCCLIPWWMARLSSQDDVIWKFLMIQTMNGAVTGILSLVAVDLLPRKLERLAQMIYFFIIWTCVLTGGILVHARDVARTFNWLTKISYVRYSMEGLLALDLTHVKGGVEELNRLDYLNQFWVDVGMCSIWLFFLGSIYWYLLYRRHKSQMDLASNYQKGDLTAPDLPLTNLQPPNPLHTPLLFGTGAPIQVPPPANYQPPGGGSVASEDQKRAAEKRAPPTPVGARQEFDFNEMLDVTPMTDSASDKKINLSDSDSDEEKDEHIILSLYEVGIYDRTTDTARMEDISFHIRECQVTGLLGPSNLNIGLLISVMTGWNKTGERLEVRGKVVVEGGRVSNPPKKEDTLLRCGVVAYVQEGFLLPDYLTCAEAIEHALSIHRPGNEKNEKRGAKFLKMVELYDQRKKLIHSLSPSDRIRLAIAYYCCTTEASVYIIEQPLTGLTLLEMSDLMQDLKKMVKVAKKAIVLTASSLPNFIMTKMDELVILTHKDENLAVIRAGKPKEVVGFFQKEFPSLPSNQYENASDEMIDWVSRTDPLSRRKLEKEIVQYRKQHRTPESIPPFQYRRVKKKGFFTEHTMLFKFIRRYLEQTPTFTIALFDVFVKSVLIGLLFMGMKPTDWNLFGVSLAIAINVTVHSNSYQILEPVLKICDSNVLHGKAGFGPFTVVFFSIQLILSFAFAIMTVTIPFACMGLFSLRTFITSTSTFALISFFWDSVILCGFAQFGNFRFSQFWTSILIPFFTVFSGFFITKKHIPGYLRFLYHINPIRMCLENIIISIYAMNGKLKQIRTLYGYSPHTHTVFLNLLMLTLLSCLIRLLAFILQKRRFKAMRYHAIEGFANPVGYIDDDHSSISASDSSFHLSEVLPDSSDISDMDSNLDVSEPNPLESGSEEDSTLDVDLVGSMAPNLTPAMEEPDVTREDPKIVHISDGSEDEDSVSIDLIGGLDDLSVL